MRIQFRSTYGLLLLLCTVVVAQTTTFTDVSTDAGIDLQNAYGAAMIDFDKDRDLDIYVANNAGANVLYENMGDGTFAAASSSIGLSSTSTSRSTAWADFDKDGDLDVFIANRGRQQLLRNDDGVFTDINIDPNASYNAYCAAWADFDKDGDLDLFVGNFDGQDRLYRNNRDYTFTDVTTSVGISSRGNTRAVAWADFDNDRDLDLFIGRGATFAGNTDALYQNEDGFFTDVTDSFGLGGIRLTLSAAWADFDNDRDLDLFLSTFENEPNRLFRNDRGTFTDVAAELGLADMTGCQGASWVDFDNDRDLDLFISRTLDGGPLVFQNNRIQFSEVTDSLGLSSNISIVGHSWGDYDRDGDLDLYLPTRNGQNRLYRNNTNNLCFWLHIDAVGGEMTNSDAWGAWVGVYNNGEGQWRELDGGQGRSTQNSPTEEFGLGDYPTADSVIIEWPISGLRTILTDVAANQLLTVQEDLTLLQETETLPTEFHLQQNYPNPFNPSTTFDYQLPNDARVLLEVYNILGQRIITLIEEQQTAGNHSITWNGRNDFGQPISSGIYLVRFEAASYQQTLRAIYLK